MESKLLKVRWVVILLHIGIAPLAADEWGVDANINQSISYDDNVTMRRDAEGSFIYQVTPVINFFHRTPVSETSASASYGIQHFFDIPVLDTQKHQEYGFDGKYWTEKTTWGLTTSYNISPSRDFAELDSGDYETDSERKNFYISPSVSYRLSSQDTLLFSARYSNTRYSSTELNDNDDKGLDLTWSHEWTKRFRSSLNVFYANYESDGQYRGIPRSIDSDSFGVNLSSSYSLSETWKAFATVGGRVTNTEITRPNQFDEDSSEGFLVDSGVSYLGENLSALLKLTRSLVPSAQGGLNEQSRFSLELDYQATERLSAAMLLSYQETDEEGDLLSEEDTLRERKNLVFQPSISWKLDRDWAVSTSYRYRYQERPVNKRKEDAHSNLIMFSVNYSWPGLSVAR